ncbi:MAG TPA: transcription antitermination factor NusB [Candidatus Eisenbacteria bacterium]|nr:transcription antitermination factor NusB [Candidatus Eisenbacteria bacterium]
MKAQPRTARRKAREVAFQLAYQADVMAEGLDADWRAREDQAALAADPAELVDDLLKVLRGRAAEVDALIQGAARNWEMDRLAATDRSVLRVATAELLGRPGTPVRVVIDEAIEIARRFGGDESARFVNGVLDQVARTLRPGEV